MLMGEQSLQPEWLSRELPSSSQDRIVQQPHERDRNHQRGYHRQLSWQNSSHSSSPLSNGSPSTLSSSWRSADPNPRVLNRSKSSPGFESKGPAPPVHSESPKSPDRSSFSDRINFTLNPRSMKAKLTKGKPPFLSSRSQPNLLANDKNQQWQQGQRLRSSMPATVDVSPNLSPSSSMSSIPVSFIPSIATSSVPTSSPISVPPPQQKEQQLQQNSPSISISSPPSSSPTPTTTNGTTTAATTTTTASDEVSKALEKLKGLVPSTNPKRGANGARKGSHAKVISASKKQPFFRKASSEPALLPLFSNRTIISNDGANGADMRKIKAIKNENMKGMKETIEDSLEMATEKRNNFFKELMIKDRNHREVSETMIVLEEGDEREEQGEIDEVVVVEKEGPTQDEEKLLREMGWNPEDAEKTPMLEESEIEEVRKMLRDNLNGKRVEKA